MKPTDWDTPHAPRPSNRFTLIPWLCIEIFRLARRYARSKVANLRGNRATTYYEMTRSMRELKRIIKDEDVPLERRRSAQRALSAVLSASKSMNLMYDEAEQYDQMTKTDYLLNKDD